MEFTEQQLNEIKGAYVQGVINGLNVSTLVQLAASKISSDINDLDATQMRDAVISQHNKEVWDQLAKAVAEKPEDYSGSW